MLRTQCNTCTFTANGTRIYFKKCTKPSQLDVRTEDPAEFWYRGEIGFLDNYVIPMAKKLKECGVFGGYADECLQYALGNREEWVVKGEDIVAAMRTVGKTNLESHRPIISRTA